MLRGAPIRFIIKKLSKFIPIIIEIAPQSYLYINEVYKNSKYNEIQLLKRLVCKNMKVIYDYIL